MELFDKSKIEKEIKELPSGILNILLDAAVSVNITSIAIVVVVFKAYQIHSSMI